MPKKNNLLGRLFGELTVVGPAPNINKKQLGNVVVQKGILQLLLPVIWEMALLQNVPFALKKNEMEKILTILK